MCGIAGYLRLNGQDIGDGEVILQAMLKSMYHRGPDDEGRKNIGPASLGMRRLSIIDLVSGHQPICNEDGTIWIVFNGEIYNFHELQKIVIAKGHVLKTASDTEVIVHLYEEFGIDCLNYLEGMFAFAIWDSKEKQLFIARDRMGEKPLHYGVFEGELVFGSEIKAVLAHPKVSKQVNFSALQKYLALEYVPSPDSIFAGISKLPPAHFLLVKNGNVKTGKYWQPKIDKTITNENEAKEKLIELLGRSTELRLIADVPLGVFLSGGIDSSAIAALASYKAGEKIKTFSIGFEESSFDESEHAKTVARHLNCEHNIYQFPSKLALNMLEELWQYVDEPIADASIVPTYFLSKMTRQQVKVALAGEGGDELFGGYPTYQAHRLVSYWLNIPKILRKTILEPAIRSLPVSHNNLSFDFKAKRFINSANEPSIARHLHWMGAIPLKEHDRLIKSDLLVLNSEKELSFYHSQNGNSNKNDIVSKIMQLDMNTYLPDDLLVKSDRASMAASLEVRLPFLAYPVVEFALSLPEKFKVNGLTTKYLLKKALISHLPEKILKRPKKGFGIPVAKWLNDDFKSLVDEFLSQSFIKQQSIFNFDYVNSLLTEHRQGRFDRRKELWTLFMFQWWWQKYFR
jgi:asparagine synthase (glutamine-hydrolysing)